MKPQGKAAVLQVLEFNRSNQINIGLKKLPALTELEAVIEAMDDTVITKECVEKLRMLAPSEEEISAIKEAQREAPDLPLGSAEKFLLLLDSIRKVQSIQHSPVTCHTLGLNLKFTWSRFSSLNCNGG